MVRCGRVSILRSACGLIILLACLTAVAQESPRLASVPEALAQTPTLAPRLTKGIPEVRGEETLTPAPMPLARIPGALDEEAPTPAPLVASGIPVPLADVPAPEALDGALEESSDMPLDEPVVRTADPSAEIELVRERYPDGAVKIERQVTRDIEGNYMNHGTFTMYDPHGAILRTGEYRNGKQHGLWTRYFDEGDGDLFSRKYSKQFPGPFVSEATFVDGKLHGAWTITSRTRRKIIEWHFDSGTRHGKSTWWYPSGEKRREVDYNGGELDGEFLEWGLDNKLVTKAPFVGGRLLTRKVKWYAPGKVFYEGSYLLSREVSVPLYDWWNGTATAVTLGESGPDHKHGPWTSWYRNGQRKVAGRYREDVPVGKFTWWYENGQKQAEGEYVDGEQASTWITWYPNGQKQSTGQYDHAVPVGKWMRWEANGKLTEVHDYTLNPLEDEQISSDDKDSKEELESAKKPGAGKTNRRT